MGEKRTVLITLCHLGTRVTQYVRRLEAEGFEVRCNPLDRVYTEHELIDALPGVFATIAGGEPYTARVFHKAKALRLVARWGVGYDRIDVAAATEHGVMIAMAFGGNHEAVADGTLALMLALSHNLFRHHDRVQKGGWGFEAFPGLWRSTVGIVGLGRIGKAVARRCRGFETRILAHDVVVDESVCREMGIELVPLHTLLQQSDFVSLHAPQTPETENLLNRERLALIKPTAYVINTARGALVDEQALYEALVSGRLAGAGIDAFRNEPPVHSPLLQLENVILSPHSFGNSLKAEAVTADICLGAVAAVARGEMPAKEHVLNPAAAWTGPRDGGDR